MKASDQYLERLEREAKVWKENILKLPSDVDVFNATNPVYITATKAAIAYAAARKMMELMREEAGEQAETPLGVCRDWSPGTDEADQQSRKPPQWFSHSERFARRNNERRKNQCP